MSRPHRIVRALVALWLVLLAGAAACMNADEELLASIAANAAQIQTLESDFVQEKHLSLFDEVLRSQGRLQFQREDRLRWELLSPVRTGFVLNGGKGRRWHERTGTDDTFAIERDPIMKIVAGEFLAWVRADFDAIRKNYAIRVLQASPALLELTPRGEFAQFVEGIRIGFDPQNRHVQSVELRAADGDATVIRFENTRVNEALGEGLFDL